MKHYPFLDLAAANSPYADSLAEAAARVISSGRYIGGPEVTDMEEMLASQVGTGSAIGVSNGLDALRMSLRALILTGRISPGDEAVFPANTCAATALAIADAGLIPVPADVEPDSLLLDAANLESKLTGRTKVVVPVHLYGRLCWSDDMATLVARHGLTVVEDCAQSIGAAGSVAGPGGGKRAGSIGHIAAFSFYPTKNIGAIGDAGAVTTSDPELEQAVRSLANYGTTRRNRFEYRGFNCRLDPIQAAMLKVKLPHTDSENAARRSVATVYDSNLNPTGLRLPPLPATPEECVWHQYVVRVSPGIRDNVRARLLDRGVETDIHYPVPVHMQPCFRGIASGPLPVVEEASASMISLPVGPPATPAGAAEIAGIINDIMQGR